MHYRDIDKAIKAARKKIRVQSDRTLRNNLDFAVGGDACDAYRLGVEEAQGEILGRLEALKIVLLASDQGKSDALSPKGPP